MRPVIGEWFDDIAGAASGPAGETMRPVMGPRHPPPLGPSRRCPGNGGCVLIGCSVSTRGGENLATSADQGTQEEEMKRDKNHDNVENDMVMNVDAPALPAAPAAARQVRQYMQVG